MRILALETSDRAGSIALALSGRLVGEQILNPQQRSAQSLAPGIQSLLNAAGWKIKDVELIAITTGPGSFTGLRVGVVTAKTLAYSIGARCVGLNTLEVIASQSPVMWPRLSVAMDAGRAEVFHARFESVPESTSLVSAARWEIVEGPCLLDKERWLRGLDRHTAATGPALLRSVKLLPPNVSVVAQDQWMPRASTVAALAWRRHLSGQYDDVLTLAPLYIRKSAAEDKLEQLDRS